jgi:hypothetical protein
VANSEAAITRLIHAYAERLDLGDFAGVAELFKHAAYRSSSGGRYEGSAAVREVLDRLVLLHDGAPRTKHVMTNIVIDVDEEDGTATSRTYFTVFQATAELPLQAIVCGRYHDRFERAGGEWRFAERMIFIDLVGDLSRHLRRPA